MKPSVLCPVHWFLVPSNEYLYSGHGLSVRDEAKYSRQVRNIDFATLSLCLARMKEGEVIHSLALLCIRSSLEIRFGTGINSSVVKVPDVLLTYPIARLADRRRGSFIWPKGMANDYYLRGLLPLFRSIRR